MSECFVVRDITPVLKLVQTKYTNGLRRIQEFHDFVFNHTDPELQLSALIDLFTFFGHSSPDYYVDVVDETSELFCFSAKERRDIENAIITMVKNGEVIPYLVFNDTTPEEGARIALYELNLMADQFGAEGRAMYLWFLLTDAKVAYSACPNSG